jgi:hypothetical protein
MIMYNVSMQKAPSTPSRSPLPAQSHTVSAVRVPKPAATSSGGSGGKVAGERPPVPNSMQLPEHPENVYTQRYPMEELRVSVAYIKSVAKAGILADARVVDEGMRPWQQKQLREGNYRYYLPIGFIGLDQGSGGTSDKVSNAKSASAPASAASTATSSLGAANGDSASAATASHRRCPQLMVLMLLLLPQHRAPIRMAVARPPLPPRPVLARLSVQVPLQPRRPHCPLVLQHHSVFPAALWCCASPCLCLCRCGQRPPPPVHVRS